MHSAGNGVEATETANGGLFRRGEQIGWIAEVPGTDDKYLGIFKTGDTAGDATATLAEMGLNGVLRNVRDLGGAAECGPVQRAVRYGASTARFWALPVQVLPG